MMELNFLAVQSEVCQLPDILSFLVNALNSKFNSSFLLCSLTASIKQPIAGHNVRCSNIFVS